MRLMLKAAFLWLMLATLPGLAQAEPVQFRGSYAVIDLPPGFTEQRGMTGAISEISQTSILVTELPVEAYDGIANGLLNDPKVLLGDGIELKSAAKIVQDGHPAVLAQGRQQVGAHPFEKWMLLVGAPHVTMLVTVQAPSVLTTADRRAVIDGTLASLRVSNTRSDLRDGLPFVFADSTRMQFSRVLSGTTALLVERTGDRAEDKDSASRPVFVIGASAKGDCAAWKDGTVPYAEQLIGSMNRTRDLTNLTSRQTTIQEDPAIVTEAQAFWHDQPVMLFQTMRFRDCQYLRTIGIAPIAEAPAYRTEFDELVGAAQWRSPSQQ